MRRLHLARDGPRREAATGYASRRTKRCTGDVTGLASLFPQHFEIVTALACARDERRVRTAFSTPRGRGASVRNRYRTAAPRSFHGKKSDSGSVGARANWDGLPKPCWRIDQTACIVKSRVGAVDAGRSSSNTSRLVLRNVVGGRAESVRVTLGGGPAAAWVLITLWMICVQTVHMSGQAKRAVIFHSSGAKLEAATIGATWMRDPLAGDASRSNRQLSRIWCGAA